MRPLRLSLQAFGSYGGELSIDFRRLGRHGIFAICGPTGAGKSTIFDAMVYALYDDLPGFRVDGNIRSQYAAETTPTKVCFEFEIHGQEWRIERCPTQVAPRRQGKRDGGGTVKQSTVVLSRTGVEGAGTSRKAEVKAKVEELVGLTKAQFEQVVLIPQGRFEEVLKSETKDRAPLLRRLFPVEIFTNVTGALRAIASDRSGSFEEATRHRSVLVDRARSCLEELVAQLPAGMASPFPAEEPEVSDFDQEAIDEHVRRAVSVASEIEGLVQAANDKTELARRDHDSAVRAAERWQQWQEDRAQAAAFAVQEDEDAGERVVLDRAVTLQMLDQALDRWRVAADEIFRLDEERAGLRKLIDDAWIERYDRTSLDAPGGAQALAEQIGGDADTLERAAGDFERLSREERMLTKARMELEERVLQQETAREALTARAKALEAKSAEAEKLRSEAATVDALTAAVAALTTELERAAAREEAGRETARLESELAVAVRRAKQAQKTAEVVRGSWRAGLAGRLAQGLVAGEPCPTCGSVDHPVPAAVLENAADDDELTAAEAAAREAADQVGGLKESLGRLAGISETLAVGRERSVVEAEHRDGCERLRTAQEAKVRLGHLAESNAAEAEALATAKAGLESDERAVIGEWGALGSRAAKFGSDRAAFVAAHGAFASTADAAASRHQLSEQVRSLREVLSALETESAVQGHLGSVLEPTMAAFTVDAPTALLAWRLPEDEVEVRDRQWKERVAHRKQVRARIEEYERGGGPVARPDPGPFEAALAAATEVHAGLIGCQAVIRARVDELAQVPDELAKATKAVEQARTSLEQARTVADLCAGSGAGPVHLRLSLENWVLADYLRRVLDQANGRLATMTAGRYALQLSDGQIDGRKQWGLELDAFDVNTGQTRPVSTLSGGETFMAALALALGLADVVSGGSNRDLGALFVDEGFGSLDPQSLDAVVDVLRSLEQGGRVVGVISHVEELKQALPTGISVTSSNAGSRAEVHYPPE